MSSFKVQITANLDSEIHDKEESPQLLIKFTMFLVCAGVYFTRGSVAQCKFSQSFPIKRQYQTRGSDKMSAEKGTCRSISNKGFKTMGFFNRTKITISTLRNGIGNLRKLVHESLRILETDGGTCGDLHRGKRLIYCLA